MKNRMRYVCPMAAALLIVLAPGAAAAAGEEPEHPSSVLFYRYCSECHGMGADGNGVRAPELVPPPADLRLLEQKYGSPVPRVKLLSFVLGTWRMGHPRICGGRVLAKLPYSPTLEIMKRGTLLTVLDFLETIQTTELEHPGTELAVTTPARY